MNSNSKVHQITRMAILVAIIFLLAFTPLGYLTIGPIAATTIQMPVIVGAVRRSEEHTSELQSLSC